MSQDNVSVLVGEGRQGDFVHASQEMAAQQDFGKVSKLWYDKTLPYEDGFKQLEAGKSETEDLFAKPTEMVPAVNDSGKFGFRYSDGRFFIPTDHCMSQVGNWSDSGTWLVRALRTDVSDQKGRLKYTRDAQDAETLAYVVKNGFRRLPQDKRYLFRTRKDGSLRAMMSDIYAIVDNRWLLETFKELIPGGRLSHWRGDSDTIWGNILIPDSIREDKDSDYGGLEAIGNSEIGERRLLTRPSIFRAICMNGCIWDCVNGTEIRQVHRGRIDLSMLKLQIKDNLTKQIPLLPQLIDRLLGTRAYGYDGASIDPLIAEVSLEHKLAKKYAAALLAAYQVEVAETPDYAKTLFSVVNSTTRAGQSFDNDEWYKLDEVGGRLASLDATGWSKLTSRAKALSTKDVDEVFGRDGGRAYQGTMVAN